MGADWRSRDSDVLRGWSQHEHQWATAIGRWRPLSRGTFHKVWRQRHPAARSPTDTDQKLLGQVRFFFCWHLILEQWRSQEDCSSWYTVIFMHQPITCSGGIIFSGRPSGCPSVNTNLCDAKSLYAYSVDGFQRDLPVATVSGDIAVNVFKVRDQTSRSFSLLSASFTIIIRTR